MIWMQSWWLLQRLFRAQHKCTGDKWYDVQWCHKSIEQHCSLKSLTGWPVSTTSQRTTRQERTIWIYHGPENHSAQDSCWWMLGPNSGPTNELILIISRGSVEHGLSKSILATANAMSVCWSVFPPFIPQNMQVWGLQFPFTLMCC